MEQVNATVDCDVSRLDRPLRPFRARQGHCFVALFRHVPADVTEVFVRVFRENGAYFDITAHEHRGGEWTARIPAACFPSAGDFGILVVADTESGILKQAFTFVPKRKNRKGGGVRVRSAEPCYLRRVRGYWRIGPIPRNAEDYTTPDAPRATPADGNRKPTAMKKPLQHCLAAILAAALATTAVRAVEEIRNRKR